MNQFQIMEQNLSKLMNQHQSMPSLCQEEPSDPFQKLQFGKKMRKSKIGLRAPSPLQKDKMEMCHMRDVSFEQLPMPTHKDKNDREDRDIQEEEEEEDIYTLEMKSLFRKLKNRVNQMEQFYLQQAKHTRKITSEGQYSQIMDNLLGHLEGSVQFIINDCLKIDPVHKEPAKIVKEISKANKENIRSNNKQTVRTYHKRNKSNHGLSRGRQSQKSIYESVLEERELKKAKKRMM